MFLLLWNSPIVAHDQRNIPDYQPSLVRYEPAPDLLEDDELLVLWWALNEQTNY